MRSDAILTFNDTIFRLYLFTSLPFVSPTVLSTKLSPVRNPYIITWRQNWRDQKGIRTKHYRALVENKKNNKRNYNDSVFLVLSGSLFIIHFEIY